MSEVSKSLLHIKRSDGSDLQHILHLLEVLKQTENGADVPELLTLSPWCKELFDWWDSGPGQHAQSRACFEVLACVMRVVTTHHPEFEPQAIAIGRKVIKERLHSVYNCLSKYSSTAAKTSCLEFLILLNCFSSSVSKDLLDHFNFGNMALQQMFRQSGLCHELVIRFYLSFLCVSTVDVKVRFMSIKNILKTLAHNISKESGAIKREILQVFMEHVLADNIKIQKKVKCQFFATAILVKISSLWSDSDSDIRDLTTKFLLKIFSRKSGILFETSSNDIFRGATKNPILMSFIKHTPIKYGEIEVFLDGMSQESPEIWSSQCASYNTSIEYVKRLLSTYSNLNIPKLLSVQLDSDVTDQQIMNFIIPKTICSLIEKHIKGGNLSDNKADNSVIRDLLEGMLKGAKCAVDLLPSRPDLKHTALLNMVDIAVLHQHGLLTSNIAYGFLQLDRFCLHGFKLESIIWNSRSIPHDCDIKLLESVCPSSLTSFVKRNKDIMLGRFLVLDLNLRELFKKVIGSRMPKNENLLLDVITSLLFDCHQQVQIKVDGKFEKCQVEHRRELMTLLLNTSSPLDLLKKDDQIPGIIREFVKYLSGAEDLPEVLLQEDVMSVLEQPSGIPFHFLSSYCHASDWPCDFSQSFGGIWSLAFLSLNLCKLFTICVKFKRMSFPLLALLNLITEDFYKPSEHHSDIKLLLNELLKELVNVSYQFSELEFLECVRLSEQLDEGVVKQLVQLIRFTESEPTDDYRGKISDNIEKLSVVAGSVDLLPVSSTKPGVCYLLDVLGRNPGKIGQHHVTWLLKLLRSNSVLSDKILGHVNEDQLNNLYNTLIDLEVSSTDQKEARLNIIVTVEDVLNTKHGQSLAFTLSVSELKDLSGGSPETVSKLICKTKPSSKADAKYLLSEVLRLGHAQFVTSSPHFDDVVRFTSCMNNKKTLKGVLELCLQQKDGNIKDLQSFLTTYVTVYEENLPKFVNKQIKLIFTQLLESLEEPPDDTISRMKLLATLLATFTDIIPTDTMVNIFITLVDSQTIQNSITLPDPVPSKTCTTKLLSLLLEFGKIPVECFTESIYLLFQCGYGGTTHDADVNILAVLKYLEVNNTGSKYPFAHGKYVEEVKNLKNVTLYSEVCIKILEDLPVGLINDLIDNFPNTKNSPETLTMDLEYLLSFMYHVIQTGEVQVRTLLCHPVTRVLFLALSSHDTTTRNIGYLSLEKIGFLIEEEKFKEKSMCQYFFKMIRNSIVEEYSRLPHLSVYFIGKLLHELFIPHSLMYGKVCHFLLQRPVFDFSDVPMFYNLFCSSSLQYKQEQMWLLDILVGAVRDEADYKILSRRHVVPYCLSQLSCPNVDKNTGNLIKKLLGKVLGIKSVGTQKDLVDMGITNDILSF